MKTMYFIHYFELKLETITSVLSRHVNFFIEGKYMGFFPLSFLNSSRKTFQIKTENFVKFSYKLGAKNKLLYSAAVSFLFIYTFQLFLLNFTFILNTTTFYSFLLLLYSYIFYFLHLLYFNPNYDNFICLQTTSYQLFYVTLI